MKGLAQLPRYRDPITRNVARLLLRSLQEQHRAPSTVVVEFEARFGQQVGVISDHRYEFPLATATAAIIDSLHSTLYTFESGVTRPIMTGVELALIDKGIAAPNDIRSRNPSYPVEDVVLEWKGGRRVMCDFGTLMEMQRRAKSAARGDASSASVSATSSPVVLKNPFSVSHAIVTQAAIEKKRTAQVDMCCPGWCADLRFAISTEVSAAANPQEMVAALPDAARYRNRASFPVNPFFTVFLTHSFTQHDLWWHPSYKLSTFCRPSDVAGLGKGTVIPTPPLYPARGAELHPHHVSRNSRDGSSVGVLPVHEIEVEVNIKAVLQAWKKVYGGAAASAYLSSAELVSSTIVGTSFDPFSSPAQSSSERFTDAEVRAFTLSEREDPFLLRVAEDYLALLQYLGQIRTFD